MSELWFKLIEWILWIGKNILRLVATHSRSFENKHCVRQTSVLLYCCRDCLKKGLKIPLLNRHGLQIRANGEKQSLNQRRHCEAAFIALGKHRMLEAEFAMTKSMDVIVNSAGWSPGLWYSLISTGWPVPLLKVPHLAQERFKMEGTRTLAPNSIVRSWL